MSVTNNMLHIKLVNMLGEDAAGKLANEILSELNLTKLSTALDRYNFGRCLTKKGGVFESIGKSIQIQATLFSQKWAKQTNQKPDVKSRQNFEHSDKIIESAFNNMLDGVLVVQKDGTLLVLNQSAEQITGLGTTFLEDNKEHDEFGFFKLDKQTPLAHDELPIVRALGGETVTEYELFMRNISVPDGAFISVNASPIKDSDGQIYAAVVVSRNVNNKIETELEIKKKTAELERSYGEIEQFSYQVCHDLVSPLNSIASLTRFVKKDLGNNIYDEVGKNIGRIQELAEKLIFLVRDIINLTKADNLNEPGQTIDIKQIEIDIRERLSILIVESGVKLIFEYKFSGDFFAPKTRFTQILENLISNGVKYCDKNKAARFVKVVLESKKDKLHIHIEDNGLGIPEKYKSNVFSMFRRFHPEISYGSGLGLYLIKKHVDHLGGTIDFTSTESGTTFHVTLKQSDRLLN